MDKWVKRKWLRALKSGEYVKGVGYLGVPYNGCDPNTRMTYCCLGVLACEMTPEFAQENEYKEIAVDKATDLLPDDLAILWGLDAATQDHLANVNDANDTFDEVIAYIENNL